MPIFSGRSDAECLVSIAAKTCPKLEAMDIVHCPKLSDDCMASIIESDMGKSLKCLNLECTPLSTHWGTSQVTKLRQLTSLNLFNSRLFESGDLESIAYNCLHLERLNLEEVCFRASCYQENDSCLFTFFILKIFLGYSFVRRICDHIYSGKK